MVAMAKAIATNPFGDGRPPVSLTPFGYPFFLFAQNPITQTLLVIRRLDRRIYSINNAIVTI